MLESLKNLDAELLLFFNRLNNPFLDFIFYWFSDKWFWIPFYAFLAWKVFRFDKSNFLLIVFFIAVAITISDQISSALIKANVMRLRPCHDPALAAQLHLVKDYCGGQYGFVSSHAANVFALAAFITRLFKRKNLTNFFNNLQSIFKEQKSVNETSSLSIVSEPSEEYITDKLLDITDKSLIIEIKPLLKMNKVLEAVKVCSLFYKGKYKSMTFKDWFKLVNTHYQKINSQV